MFTQEDLAKLVNEVEEHFTSHLAKAEQEFRLAKSEDGEDKEPKESEEKPEGEEKGDKPAEAAPEMEAAPEEKPAAEAPATSEAPAQDGSGYDAEDLAHLEEMYASMSFDELMAHHDAVKMALDAKTAETDSATAAPAAEAPAEMAPEAPAAAPATESAPDPFQKSESSEMALLKSELQAQKAKSEELKKSFDTVSQALVSFVSKKSVPQGKAITNVETIAKSEASTDEKALTLSKAQVSEILKKKTADMSLQKSDRELINAYYLVKGTSIDSIAHLLK